MHYARLLREQCKLKYDDGKLLKKKCWTPLSIAYLAPYFMRKKSQEGHPKLGYLSLIKRLPLQHLSSLYLFEEETWSLGRKTILIRRKLYFLGQTFDMKLEFFEFKLYSRDGKPNSLDRILNFLPTFVSFNKKLIFWTRPRPFLV